MHTTATMLQYKPQPLPMISILFSSLSQPPSHSILKAPTHYPNSLLTSTVPYLPYDSLKSFTASNQFGTKIIWSLIMLDF